MCGAAAGRPAHNRVALPSLRDRGHSETPRVPPHGVSPAGVASWFDSTIRPQRPAGETLDIQQLINFLTKTGMVVVTETGNYALTELGEALHQLDQAAWHAPKAL
jgi:hypothetical protein